MAPINVSSPKPLCNNTNPPDPWNIRPHTLFTVEGTPAARPCISSSMHQSAVLFRDSHILLFLCLPSFTMYSMMSFNVHHSYTLIPERRRKPRKQNISCVEAYISLRTFLDSVNKFRAINHRRGIWLDKRV